MVRAVKSPGGALGILRALCLFAAAAAPSLDPTPSLAQGSEWVNPDVITLREEVDRLSREVARLRGGGPVSDFTGGGDGGAGAPVGGDVYVRLDRMEQELRRLTGEVERLSFAAAQADQRRDAKLAELDFRMGRLEGGETGPYEGGPIPGATAPASEGSAGVRPPQTSESEGGQRAALAPLTPQGESEGAARLGAPPGVLGRIPGDSAQTAVAGPIYDGAPQPPAPPTFGGAAPGGAPAAAASGAAVVSYDDALESLRAGAFDAAEGQLQAFIAQNPSDARRGDATYWLGETYYVRSRFGEAARTFLTSVKEHPDAGKAPDSMLKLGMSLAQLNRVDEACQTFAQVSARYPDAPANVLRRAQNEARRANCS